MSNLNFSKSKFSRFISSKGFYVAVAVCLVGAGTATWFAVDRTITGIENNNTQMIESENQWNDFPEVEADTKKSGVELPKGPQQSPYASSSASSSLSSASSAPASEPAAGSEQSGVPVNSLTLPYALPISSEIAASFSGGELVKNTTLKDWRTHDGVDIIAESGTDVLAAADGVVSEVRNDPLWGTMLTIDHADGNQTLYCGLDQVLPVKEGDSVMIKQVVGRLEGVPCEINETNHLHFAMKREGKWIDPLSVFQKQVTE